MKSSLWSSKYKPNNLDSIFGQDDNIKAIKEILKQDELPNLLFYGPSGTGKTSVASAITEELFGDKKDFMTLSLNASDERGVKTIRNIIHEFISTKSFYEKFKQKIVILDEADYMTSNAQLSLKRIMDTTNSTKFIIICNVLNKIEPSIYSRCLLFHFKQLSKQQIKEFIMKNLTIDIEEAALNTLCNYTNDLRLILNILQILQTTKITEKKIIKFINYPTNDQYETLLEKINNNVGFEQIHNWFVKQSIPISHWIEFILKKNGNISNSLFEKIIELEKITKNGELNKFYSFSFFHIIRNIKNV